MKHILMISASLIGLALAQSAAAQESSVQSDAPVDETRKLEEVIVTATRRSENLRDVPISVSVFSQEKLSADGIVGYEGLARETPGIVLNKPTANFNTFTARGIATNGYGANLQSTVAIYIDGLPISRTGNTTLIDPNLYDVERVEFLRGPQGTLFGSGSLAGALRILTKSPNLSRFESSALVDLGVTGSDSFRQRYNAMINTPIIEDKLGLRVVGYYRHEEGYVDNIQTGVENADTLKDFGGRMILLAEPTDRLSLRLLASYENNKPQDSSLTNPDLGEFKRRSVRPDIFSGKQKNLNATVEYAFDGATLTSSTTYSDYNQVFGADISAAVGRAFPYLLEASGPEKSFVQETRIVSDKGGKWDWVVGGFYFDRKTELTNALRSSADYLAGSGLTGARGANGDLIGSQTLQLQSHELAGFGELTYHFSDDLWATGGIRYGRTDSQLTHLGGFDTDYILASLLQRSGPLTIVPIAPATQPKITGNRPSFKGSLSYRLSEDVTTYALVSTGYRAPVYNTSAGQVSLIDPNDLTIPDGAESDTLTNYEAGVKGRFLDGKVSANLALYWIDWDDIQVQANRVSDSKQFATNIGSARSRGLEFEIRANPVEALTLGFSGMVGDTEITSLTASEAAISGAVAGDRLSSPEFQGSLFAQVDFDLTPDLSGYFNMDVQHVGSYPNMFPNVPGSPGTQAPTYGYVDAYENVNARFNLTSGNISAILYVENLLDSDPVTYIHPEGYLDARYGTLRPRTVGIRLSYSH